MTWISNCFNVLAEYGGYLLFVIYSLKNKYYEIRF